MRDALTERLARQSAAPGASRLAAWLQHPTRLVLLLALVQVVLWGVLSARFIGAPQNDNLEQVLLSQDLRLVYGKHPPMPTWLLYGANAVAGPSQANLPALPPTQLAPTLQRAWAEHSTAPLRYVISDGRSGAALAVQFRGEPRVFDATRHDFVSVLPTEVLRACGSVVVMLRAPAEPGSPQFGPLDALFDASAPRAVVELPVPGTAAQTFYMAIRIPLPGGHCPETLGALP